MRDLKDRRLKPVHAHAWLWEPLEGDPTFVLRAMFGTKAVYLEGKMVFCFAAKAEPWRGVLVCTDRVHHASMIAEFPTLIPHAVLPKWLYLAETEDDFERVAVRLVALAKRRDPRIGVAPKSK